MRWQCVVDTGMATASRLAMSTVTAATHSTQKPMDEVILLVTREPIIVITLRGTSGPAALSNTRLLPYSTRPSAIPMLPYSNRK